MRSQHIKGAICPYCKSEDVYYVPEDRGSYYDPPVREHYECWCCGRWLGEDEWELEEA